ncbi:MAG: hypothetical protein HAW66_03225 [Shewanella sp.]|nr:hypothetical protein [Shewanella sp.]
MNKVTDEQLDQLISELPESLNPKSTLWDEIEAKLDDDVSLKKLTQWKSLAIACGVLIAFFAGWQIDKISTTEAALPDTAMIILIDKLYEQHLQQVENFKPITKPITKQITKQIDWGDNQLNQSINAGITELSNAAQVVIIQLKLNPNDKQLWELWLWLQSREIELLKQEQQIIEKQISYSI